MARISSSPRFARFASLAVVGALAVAGAVALRGDTAEACSGGDMSIADVTTFDPGLVGEWAGLAYDPYTDGYGGACVECPMEAMLDDWQGYLKGAVTREDWQKVLLQAQLADVFAIEKRLAGKSTTAPKGFETSSLWKDPAAAPKLSAAVEIVELARRVEQWSVVDPWQAKPRSGPILVKELAAAQRGLRAAKEPFLAQRYAFQALRILFYQREWGAAAAYFEKTAKTLAAPSTDLAWRARHYYAGALRREGKLGPSLLELARIHTGYEPLVGAAMFDFRPAGDADWKEALALAKTVGEKTALWRMVGIKHDGLAGAREIFKLAPTSKLLALLVVRELSRAEGMVDHTWGTPDAKDLAAQKQAYAKVEKLALEIAATPGADRAWLMDLVAGHIAAKRGELALTKTRMQKAVAARPGDRRVASQAKASITVAMVADWKANPKHEDEVAVLMKEIDPEFARMTTLTSEVRGKLAKAYVAAGRIVDAEFLVPGTLEPLDEFTGRPTASLKAKRAWAQVPFLKEMIARTDRRATEFDRFVLQSSHVKPHLEQELAMRYLLDGDYAAAQKMFDSTTASTDLLGTDPFVIHINDCHDCDHEKLGPTATWTHANFTARLVELERIAKGGGEPAAAAALSLGNALYNITWYGNARRLLADTHQQTSDANPALRWYKRAYELTTKKELKAKAAWLASKAELANLYTAREAMDPEKVPADEPLPRTWFTAFRKFKGTRYYKDVLKECGRFRDWVGAQP